MASIPKWRRPSCDCNFPQLVAGIVLAKKRHLVALHYARCPWLAIKNGNCSKTNENSNGKNAHCSVAMRHAITMSDNSDYHWINDLFEDIQVSWWASSFFDCMLQFCRPKPWLLKWTSDVATLRAAESPCLELGMFKKKLTFLILFLFHTAYNAIPSSKGNSSSSFHKNFTNIFAIICIWKSIYSLFCTMETPPINFFWRSKTYI